MSSIMARPAVSNEGHRGMQLAPLAWVLERTPPELWVPAEDPETEEARQVAFSEIVDDLMREYRDIVADGPVDAVLTGGIVTASSLLGTWAAVFVLLQDASWPVQTAAAVVGIALSVLVGAVAIVAGRDGGVR